MVNLAELENEMREHNVSDAQMANALSIDLSTWYRRKASPSNMKIGEIEKIVTLLDLSNQKAKNIFLA